MQRAKLNDATDKPKPSTQTTQWPKTPFKLQIQRRNKSNFTKVENVSSNLPKQINT